MNSLLDRFGEVWFCDTEFKADVGERPVIHCIVAMEFHSGKTIRLWEDQLGDMPPFSVDPNSLLIAWYASAELGCFLSLGWPLPTRILDLYVEFRVATNGKPLPSDRSLLGAMVYYGLDSMEVAEKTGMRDLAIRGGPFTSDEKAALLDYCERDVDALPRLLERMADGIDLDRALLRGRYMAAVARMEHVGVPIDVDSLSFIRSEWSRIKEQLISRVDTRYGVYEEESFKINKFADWLQINDIPWPRLSSGKLALDKDTFREMAKAYPAVAPLHELRHTLGELRLESLAVGSDGRNRTLLSPFSSRTGRNQPSTSKFIFGPSCWMRGLIQPTQGRALGYVDWSQQEFAVAAALSNDLNMMDAYSSGDPYLTFAKQAGAVPPDATKKSHPDERERFKVCSLAVQYGMGEHSLARKLGLPTAHGRMLLQAHRDTYRTFRQWSLAAIDHALLHGVLWTVFGWPIYVTGEVNPRSLANFPMQANGAEMLRLAACLATERGVEVCAPVHDALLVEGPADSIVDVVATTRAAMAEASAIVLNGFRLRTDAEIITWPGRYMDKRGQVLWEEIMAIVKSGNDNLAQGPARVPWQKMPPRPVL